MGYTWVWNHREECSLVTWCALLIPAPHLLHWQGICLNMYSRLNMSSSRLKTSQPPPHMNVCLTLGWWRMDHSLAKQHHKKMECTLVLYRASAWFLNYQRPEVSKLTTGMCKVLQILWHYQNKVLILYGIIILFLHELQTQHTAMFLFVSWGKISSLSLLMGKWDSLIVLFTRGIDNAIAPALTSMITPLSLFLTHIIIIYHKAPKVPLPHPRELER